MKKILLISFLTFFSNLCFSQVTFQKGHFINNNDEIINCLIKNEEWSKNPSRFYYKLDAESETKIATIDMVKQFTIDDSRKYKRATVQISRSSDDFKKLNSQRNHVFEEETLFLQSLMEGNASLYLYKGDDYKSFFYTMEDLEIEQLLYKRYVTENNQIKFNNRFQQQVLNNLVCDDVTFEDIRRLRYDSRSLMRIFKQYNTCKDSDYTVYLNKGKASWNGAVKAGLNLSNFGIKQEGYPENNEFSLDPNLRLGMEIELILPLTNNKWSLFSEPTYSQYNAEKDFIVFTNQSAPSNPDAQGGYWVSTSIKSTGIELPFGLRHYIFLSHKSRLFFNAGLSFHYLFNSSSIEPITNTGAAPELTVEQSWTPSFFGGAGYDFNSKLSIEARYYPVKPISDNGIFEINQNHTFAIIAGYRLF